MVKPAGWFGAWYRVVDKGKKIPGLFYAQT